jgi:Holliday junction resolvasome RuvABC ATP-dependent DNA helicase subunit/uncharacterized tellurite resistance protein B-like protein
MNPLYPAYSVPLGASSVEGDAPLPIVLCVTCRSKNISSKKRFWHSNAITFVCNDCGTALEQVGDRYKLTHVTDTGSPVWQKYAGKILYRREWSNIALGGYSDQDLAIKWGSSGVANDTEVTEIDTMSAKERQLVQTARQQYVDTKLALFKSFNEAENLSDELASLRDAIVTNFDPLMERILCEIASADGPINALETEVLNILLGKQTPQAYYNELLKQPIEATKAFATAIDFAIQVGGIEKGEEYDPANDPIVACFETLGHAVVSADGKSSPHELRCLSKYTAIVHSKTAELARRILGAGMAADSSGQSIDEKTKVDTSSKAKEPPSTTERCLEQLHSLVGLASVKGEVETLTNLARVFKLRKENGLPTPDVSFHMVFSGNPGTGKTVVARIIAQIYGCLGLLSKGHVVEVDRSGLVANYVGQTATKTKKVIEQAKGGVLFIDEAYSLVKDNSGSTDFGQEAIEILLKSMEDYRDDLVVIAAGYPDRMASFLSSNPGLRSRFPRMIEFPDYSPEELVDIFQREATSNGYVLDPNAQNTIREEIKRRWEQRGADYANARDVRNLFERVIAKQADRVSQSKRITKQSLTTLCEVDIRYACSKPEPQVVS